jgi:hypothetical protein
MRNRSCAVWSLRRSQCRIRRWPAATVAILLTCSNIHLGALPNERALCFFDHSPEFNMLRKFDYVAAGLAAFLTTGVLLVSIPAHAQNVAASAAVVARATR